MTCKKQCRNVIVSHGSRFIVSRDIILSLPKPEYKKLRTHTHRSSFKSRHVSGKPSDPYGFEGRWSLIFSCYTEITNVSIKESMTATFVNMFIKSLTALKPVVHCLS